MMDQQTKQRRVRGFVNRLKFRLANWLLKPFNLMIVSSTDFRAIRYVHNQMVMYIKRSGALPHRIKARRNLRTYLEAQQNAINNCTNLALDPIELDEMPPDVAALASILQEAEKHRDDKARPAGTDLAKSPGGTGGQGEG